MEFLKGLQEATQMGITKEEYMAAWKQEMEIKLREARAREMMSAKDITQVLPGDDREMADDCSRQHPQQLSMEREGHCKQLEERLEQFDKNMTELHKRQLQLTQDKQDNMLKELVQHLVDLSRYFRGEIENQIKGMGQVIIAELDKIKQHSHSEIKGERQTGLSQPANQQRVPTDVIAASTSAQAGITHPQPKQHDLKLQQQTSWEHKEFLQQQQTENENEQPQGESVWEMAQTEQHSENFREEAAQVICPDTCTDRTQTSADTEPSQQLNSPASFGASGISFQEDQEMIPLNYLPVKDTSLLIEKCNAFSLAHKTKKSQFYWTRSRSCKVRLSVGFTQKDELRVRVQIYKGPEYDWSAWPITFMGTGYIYNETSDCYSRIWELPPTTCCDPKPGKKISLRAKVCLVTNTASQPNITFAALKGKNYTPGDRLLFSWDFDAEEYNIC